MDPPLSLYYSVYDIDSYGKNCGILYGLHQFDIE